MTIVDGKFSWNEIKIDFTDITSNNPIRNSLIKIIQFFKTKVDNNGFIFYIKSLDPTGVEIYKWAVEVDGIKNVNFGSFDYISNDNVECSLTLTTKSCHLR